MKVFKALLLPVVFLLTSAFTSAPFMWLEESASFNATVDGVAFKLSNEQLYRGLLVNRAASMDGKIPARTVISTTFTGLSDGTEGRLIADNIQFEIGYNPGKTGAPDMFVVAAQYKNANYHMLKEQSKLNVTSFVWEDDRKHFILSADFDCKMRSFGYPSDKLKDVSLKGRMENIRITVPSWLAAKVN
jgi:hypothetical protein